MWIFDRRSGAILAANDAAARAYGYTREQLLACKVDEICRPCDPGRGLLTTPRSEGASWTGTLRQSRKDGSTFEADVAMTETGDPEHPATMVLVQPVPGSDRT